MSCQSFYIGLKYGAQQRPTHDSCRHLPIGLCTASKHQVVRSHFKYITLKQGKTKQYRIRHQEKKMGISHTLQKPVSNIIRQSLEWNLQRKCKVGRPEYMWRRKTDFKAKAARMTWVELKDLPEPCVLEMCGFGPMFSMMDSE